MFLQFINLSNCTVLYISLLHTYTVVKYILITLTTSLDQCGPLTLHCPFSLHCPSPCLLYCIPQWLQCIPFSLHVQYTYSSIRGRCIHPSPFVYTPTLLPPLPFSFYNFFPSTSLIPPLPFLYNSLIPRLPLCLHYLFLSTFVLPPSLIPPLHFFLFYPFPPITFSLNQLNGNKQAYLYLKLWTNLDINYKGFFTCNKI